MCRKLFEKTKSSSYSKPPLLWKEPVPIFSGGWGEVRQTDDCGSKNMQLKAIIK
jgi:hypothetical protein